MEEMADGRVSKNYLLAVVVTTAPQIELVPLVNLGKWRILKTLWIVVVVARKGTPFADNFRLVRVPKSRWLVDPVARLGQVPKFVMMRETVVYDHLVKMAKLGTWKTAAAVGEHYRSKD